MTHNETVAALLAALTTVRREYPTIEAQTMQALFHVAAHPGQTVQDVGTAIGMTTASATRNVSYLLDYRAPGERGYGLVQMALDPYDRRIKRLTLTQRGQAFIDSIARACTAAVRVAARKES